MKAVRVQYSDFWPVRAGKLSENRMMFDRFSLLQQIGRDPLRPAEAER